MGNNTSGFTVQVLVDDYPQLQVVLSKTTFIAWLNYHISCFLLVHSFQAVAHYAERRCKCHGMSGSCQLKTCWMQTPHFRDVGDRLMRKFSRALEIRARNTNSGSVELVTRSVTSGYRKKRRQPPQEELVFLEKSPDFCDPDPRFGSPGTGERYCNRTSTGIDGCDSLCCGRGYNIRLERRTEWCNCTFHWCCYVRCQQCHSSEWVNQCKWTYRLESVGKIRLDHFAMHILEESVFYNWQIVAKMSL